LWATARRTADQNIAAVRDLIRRASISWPLANKAAPAPNSASKAAA
jgi:hypothetical protein